jgi:hypothetical protein
MKNFALHLQKKKFAIALFLLAFWLFGTSAQIFAHGGEDHGDQKPKATTSDKGTVTRSARLGEYELTLKHQFLEPDTSVSAKMFLTKFKTNEAVDNAAAKIEIESAVDGSVTEAAVEKTETAGSYNVKIPALPQGVYTVRARLTYGGETDTATFSNVEVAPAPSAAVDGSAMSLARTALIAFVFALVLALFGGLIYFVWNFAGASDERGEQSPIRGETVSA